jgi:hypothetical protein
MIVCAHTGTVTLTSSGARPVLRIWQSLLLKWQRSAQALLMRGVTAHLHPSFQNSKKPWDQVLISSQLPCTAPIDRSTVLELVSSPASPITGETE